MVTVPAATPNTFPIEPTVAIAVAPELHEPLSAASVKLIVTPTHTVAIPPILSTLANASIVTTLVAV